MDFKNFLALPRDHHQRRGDWRSLRPDDQHPYNHRISGHQLHQQWREQHVLYDQLCDHHKPEQARDAFGDPQLPSPVTLNKAMKEQNEHIAAALQALRNFTAQSDPSERELSAVQVASSIINDLGGTSAYNVLASLICGFTAACSRHPVAGIVLHHPGLSVGLECVGAGRGHESDKALNGYLHWHSFLDEQLIALTRYATIRNRPIQSDNGDDRRTRASQEQCPLALRVHRSL